MLVPCACGATTFEIYESFKQILDVKQPNPRAPITIAAKPHKIKMYEVLATLVTVKPDFVLGMGRFESEMLPPIQLLFKKEGPFDSIESKLGVAMLSFLDACHSSFENLEKTDQKRFGPVYESIKQARSFCNK